MRYSGRVAGQQDQTDGAVQERVRDEQRTPRQYNVVLLNDDYSTMDFVVHVLESVFQKSPSEAYGIMMQVHLQGRGLAGVYTHEIAETKVDTVATLARDAGFPLRAIMEEA